MIIMAQMPDLHVIYKQCHIGGMVVYKRDKPSARVLVDPLLYFRERSNSCKARAHLVSLALLGAHSAKDLSEL